MNKYIKVLFTFGILSIITMGSMFKASAQSKQQLYRIKIYHLDTSEQEARVDQYLKKTYLPSLHRVGITHVGVFKPVRQDTTSDRRIYVFTPFDSFAQLASLPEKLEEDQQYQETGKTYIKAKYDQPAYNHFETILLKAFPLVPHVRESQLEEPKPDRIYELRSYFSPTVALHENKVQMFNQGGEIDLFDKLKFNPIFYGDVLSGSNMPNLMYMITFKDMESRKEHWDAFFNAPKWKNLSSMPQYQHNVTKVHNWFLHPTTYSDL